MKASCCKNSKFIRHPDPLIADIGEGGGAEYTIGSCGACQALLIHCWIAGGAMQAVYVVKQELIDRFVAQTDYKTRKKMLSAWFDEVS